ncbi:hypothetical protein ASE60_23555 [Ensifer sp. Root278]|nr:hypothetical protein ASE60_23555 [Ensifer sp. Root278]
MLKAADPLTGKPIVDLILDKAGQKGTGKWSVIEAQNMGVPATGIEAAVAARSISSMKVPISSATGSIAPEAVTPIFR